MQNEIEAKYLHVDFAVVRRKLKQTGAHCTQPMFTMKRTTYDTPDRQLAKKHGWIRLRQEQGKISLVYKQVDAYDIDKVFEAAVAVDNYESAQGFLRACGFEEKSQAVTRREIWKLGEVEICLDEWPWLDSYIEIEGPNESAVQSVAEALGFTWDNAQFGPVEVAYMDQYNCTVSEVNNHDVFDFDMPLPEWAKKKQ